MDAAKTVRIIQGLLEIRRKGYQEEFESAKQAHQYSKLPGFHAMLEALGSAARHIATEKLTTKKEFLDLAARFGSYIDESNQARDTAFEHERYADVVGHDGAGTGWIIAKKLIEDEIKSA